MIEFGGDSFVGILYPSQFASEVQSNRCLPNSVNNASLRQPFIASPDLICPPANKGFPPTTTRFTSIATRCDHSHLLNPFSTSRHRNGYDMQQTEYRIARFLVEDASDSLHRLLAQKAVKSHIDASQLKLDRAMKRLDTLTQAATEEERREVSAYLAEDSPGC